MKTKHLRVRWEDLENLAELVQDDMNILETKIQLLAMGMLLMVFLIVLVIIWLI